MFDPQGITSISTHTMLQSQGTILHLQRLSTEDGPGLRTTVFFKGCPLRCAWCHNPESLYRELQLQWMGNRCIGCNTCLEACQKNALLRDALSLQIDRERCTLCGRCVEECPAAALEMLGKKVKVVDLVDELLKDRVYYEKSGGGVTLSGGEPTLQMSFTRSLLEGLKEAGIHTALDTCGFCSSEALEDLIPHVDLVLYDLKLMDSEQHLHFTAQSNRVILENLQRLKGILSGKTIWIRTPLIPGATIGEENITSIGKFISHHLDGGVERWELCAFNNLCRDKYRRLGMDWSFWEAPLLGRQELAEIEAVAKRSGFDPDRIFVTGAVRLEEK